MSELTGVKLVPNGEKEARRYLEVEPGNKLNLDAKERAAFQNRAVYRAPVLRKPRLQQHVAGHRGVPTMEGTFCFYIGRVSTDLVSGVMSPALHPGSCAIAAPYIKDMFEKIQAKAKQQERGFDEQ